MPVIGHHVVLGMALLLGQLDAVLQRCQTAFP
jgi:hypothetical protein